MLTERARQQPSRASLLGGLRDSASPDKPGTLRHSLLKHLTSPA